LQELSRLVAKLYRRCEECGLLANRLLVESFVIREPYWALRTGSVPFWLEFTMEPPAAFLERCLDTVVPTVRSA
jgi:hypothetical protein